MEHVGLIGIDPLLRGFIRLAHAALERQHVLGVSFPVEIARIQHREERRSIRVLE